MWWRPTCTTTTSAGSGTRLPDGGGVRVAGGQRRGVRPPESGHLTGSLGFELSEDFVTYPGWLYRYGTPLTLIGVSDFAGLAAAMARGQVQILDTAATTRQPTGRCVGPGTFRCTSSPSASAKFQTVQCGCTAARVTAPIAASVIDRPARQVVLVNDFYDAAKDAGLEDDEGKTDDTDTTT